MCSSYHSLSRETDHLVFLGREDLRWSTLFFPFFQIKEKIYEGKVVHCILIHMNKSCSQILHESFSGVCLKTRRSISLTRKGKEEKINLL